MSQTRTFHVPWRSININYDNWFPKSWKIPTVPTTRIFSMHNKMTRRSIVKGGLIAGALVPAFGLIGGTARAAALTPLDPRSHSQSAGIRERCHQGGRRGQPHVQARSEMQQLCAVSGQAGGSDGRLQYFRGT